MSGARKVKSAFAGGYLLDALEAVRSAGRVECLYDPDIREEHPPIARDWVPVVAAGRRMRYSRTALLLAAFAAEAYINEILQERLDPETFTEVDRQPFPQKYLGGLSMALGRNVLDAGARPWQSLHELSCLRNRLAHPKDADAVEITSPSTPLHPTLNPEMAMTYILEVATAAHAAISEGGRRTPDRHAGAVLASRAGLICFARRVTADLPAPDVVHPDGHDAIFVALHRLTEVVLPQFRGYGLP